MKYLLLYSKTAAKEIQKLDIIAKKRLKKKLELLIVDPLHFSKKLIHSDLGTYRYRVGDYRIIFDLSGTKIIILRIDHRREIYK